MITIRLIRRSGDRIGRGRVCAIEGTAGRPLTFALRISPFCATNGATTAGGSECRTWIHRQLVERCGRLAEIPLLPRRRRELRLEVFWYETWDCSKTVQILTTFEGEALEAVDAKELEPADEDDDPVFFKHDIRYSRFGNYSRFQKFVRVFQIGAAPNRGLQPRWSLTGSNGYRPPPNHLTPSRPQLYWTPPDFLAAHLKSLVGHASCSTRSKP
ncbi:hypothetical protein FB451DRAFT_1199059 [Mycena latifolia]|nr:hypothetical protein FB451DRAFT_1199059 [Mycena latifolia]